jgi:hypothetical protein
MLFADGYFAPWFRDALTKEFDCADLILME